MKYSVKIKMTTNSGKMTALIKTWEIIKDEGIGRLIGTLKTALKENPLYHIYEKRVRIVKSPTGPTEYGTVISKDFYSLVDDKFVKNKNLEEKIIYLGIDKFKAFNAFNKVVKKDKINKENKIYSTFSKN